MAEKSLNSKGRKNTRNGSISGYTPVGRGFFGLIWDLITGLIFFPIFICLWIVVKSVKLFHRIFVKIPDRQVESVPFNPLGVFRLAFWVWLAVAGSTSQYWAGGFPWIGFEEKALIVHSWIRDHSLGFIYLPLSAYVLWAIIMGGAAVVGNLAMNNTWSSSGLDNYNSPFENVNTALRFRDGEMNMKTSREKSQLFAQTGFLTNSSLNPKNMTPNEMEAARFLDGELGMQSSRGKLEMLKDLFAGRR